MDDLWLGCRLSVFAQGRAGMRSTNLVFGTSECKVSCLSILTTCRICCCTFGEGALSFGWLYSLQELPLGACNEAVVSPEGKREVGEQRIHDIGQS
jgi:hypothetical protein